MLLAPTTVTLTPSDDVWVYEHAADPAKDSFFRIWGTMGNAVAENPSDAGQFSYGLLKWDLSKIPAGAKITSAKPVVNQISDPGFTIDDAKAAPLEARAVNGDFAEKGWDYASSSKTFPIKGEEGIFGTGYPDASVMKDKVVPISIDLLKGRADLAKAIAQALGGPKTICLALTSKIDPSSLGRSAVYKIYTRDAERESSRPVLILSYSE